MNVEFSWGHFETKCWRCGLVSSSTYSKMGEERDKWSKREPECDELETSQPICIAQDAHARVWLDNHSLKRLDVWWMDTTNHLRNRDGVIQEGSIGDPLVWWRETCELHRRPIRFLRMLYQHKHCQPRQEGIETAGNEGRLLDVHNCTGRAQANGGTQLPTHAILQEKGRTTPKAALRLPRLSGPPRAQRTEHQATAHYSQAPRPSGILPDGFQTCLGKMTSSFLPLSPCGNENGNVYSIFVPPLYLRYR